MKSKNNTLGIRIHYNKKSQLTMFIVLGIVIISIFGFVFFATSQIAVQKANQQAEQIVNDILGTTSLKFYVNKCAEKALENGLEILSRQGGKIFPNQEGSLLTSYEKTYLQNDQASGKTYQVAYGILKDETPVPQYPCKIGFENFDISPAYCYYRSTPNFDNLDIGTLNLPRLCKNQYGGCSIREGWSPSFSVQAELESYISSYISKCVNFTSIVGINQSYLVHEGNASTNITFSDTDVNAVISFPLIITPPASQPVIRAVSFTASIGSRFKILYGIARDLALSAVQSATAKIKTKDRFSDLIAQRFNGNQGISVERKENVSFYDSFVDVFDTANPSQQGSKVQFLIENRPPVLEYVSPPCDMNGACGKDIPAGCGKYDIIQIQDQLLRLEPKAFDPDGNEITYNYSGWLEDYNETISNQVISPLNKCVISSSNQKLQFTKKSQSRWIKDPAFEHNGIVSALVTRADIGPHTIKLEVCDKQYCDYQLIRVLIDDLLNINVDKSNPYGTDVFSLEDPNTFTATIKDIYNPVDYSFSWTIKQGDTIIYPSIIGKQNISLPFAPYNILNIKTAYGLFQRNLPYTALAEVIQGGQYKISNETKVIARDCAPFKNGKPSFPYNISDPFLSDHACCDEKSNNPLTIKINGTDATCYASATYGSYNSFSSSKYVNKYDTDNGITLPQPAGYDVLQTIKTNIDSFKTTDDTSNDIFKRIFKRNCDGTRGNVCIGAMTEDYTTYKQCQDLILPGQIARCQGPQIQGINPNRLQPNTETISSPPTCSVYDKTTFEHEVGVREGITCNSQPKCVSNQNSQTGFTTITGTPHYLCNATCGTNGCSQTLPSLCHDCYQDQSCARTGSTPQSQPEIKQTTTYKKFNGCGANSVTCDIGAEQTLDDSCGSGANSNILTEYVCNSKPYNSNSPITAVTTDCSNYKERPAVDTDGGKLYSQEGTCTYYDRNQNKCQDGKCTYDTIGISIADGKVSNPDPNAIQNKYLYREWYPGNGNPAGDLSIKESCLYEDTDYDLLVDVPEQGMNQNVAKSICEGTNFGTTNGHWDSNPSNIQRRCCGDDSNEAWDGTSCKTTS